MPEISTVGELWNYLSTLPQDRKVLLAADAEGNSFSFLCDADQSVVAEDYRPDEIYLTPEQYAEDQASSDPRFGEEDEPPEGGQVVLVLWPV